MVIVVALLPVAVGVAAADPVPDVPPQAKHTAAGWDMTLTLNNITIDSVPNMAAAPLVREGFINATARLAVDGDDTTSNKGARTTLTMWVQLGCQVDLSDGASLTAAPQFQSSLPGGANLGEFLNPPGLPGASNDITDIGIQPTVTLQPQIQAKVYSGHIDNKILGSKAYPPDKFITDPIGNYADFLKKLEDAGILKKDGDQNELDFLRAQLDDVANQNVKSGLVVSVQNADIKAQKGGDTTACGGPVAARLYAKATMATANSWDTVEAYSDILSL